MCEKANNISRETISRQRNPALVGAGLLLTVIAFVYGEHIVECGENHHIRKIYDRDNHVGKQLYGVRNLCFQIYGNHCHDDNTDNKQDGHG